MAKRKDKKLKGAHIVFIFVGLAFLIIGLAVHPVFIPIGAAFIAIWLAGITKARKELEESTSGSQKE